MARKKIAPPEALPPHVGHNDVIPPLPQGPSLEDRVTELEGDLVRIVDLLVKGDLDAQKFKEILAKRQGKA